MKRALLRFQVALGFMTVGGLMSALAQASNPPQYSVVDLGQVGPSPGQPYTITGSGLIAGEIVLTQPAVSHAFLWKQGKTLDISSPGLGGPNSAAFGANLRGQVVGQADTNTADPNGEDFCGSKALALTQSGNTCVPFVWQDGNMIVLPRLRSSAGAEGSNGVALRTNDSGIAAGTAENGESDSTCPGASVSPQTIEFKPVIWTQIRPWPGAHVEELPTIGGDPDGVAYALNNRGQVVGASGTCGSFNTIELNNLTPLHAVLWQKGEAIDLGNLGGDGKAFGIFATGLNDDGQVVGASDTVGDANFHGFLWQKGHITDLGPLQGDSNSLALAIGKNGLVLGVSLDASFNLRAVLWRDGVATDLNTLVAANSTLSLQTACSINDQGEIVGFAALKTNPSEIHAYLVKPTRSGH